MRGSELAWEGVFVPAATLKPGGIPGVGSAIFASDTIPWLAYPKPLSPGWSLSDFNFDTETLAKLVPMHAIYDATDPDLSRFDESKEKLIVWHGLSDPHISPTNSIAYMEAAQEPMGKARVDGFMRLFLVLGMYHCRDGDGMTSIDVMTPLMAWVENGEAPDGLVASRNDAAASAGKGRTIFPWPLQSTLRSNGRVDNPADWETAPASPSSTLHDTWAGAGFYAPGFHRDCGFDGSNWVCRSAR